MSPLPWSLLPDTAAVDAAGHLLIGGVDTVELAAELRHAAVRLRRGPPAPPLPRGTCRLPRRRALRGQGVPVRGDGPPRARGGPGSRRRLRRRAPRGPAPPASPPPTSCCTATTSRPTSWSPRSTPASGASSSTPSTRSTASSGWCASGPAPPGGAGPGHARGRGPHPRLRRHRPGRLEVRLRPGLRRGRGRGRAAAGRPARRPASSASTCTSAARSSWPTPSPGRSSVLAPFVRRLRPARAVHRRRARRGLRRGGGVRGHPRLGRAGRKAVEAERHRRRGSRVEPGRAIAAQAAITLYTVGTIKEIPGVRTYVAIDGGMIDNPRPALYGSDYETFLPRAVAAERARVVRLVGKHCESGDVLVRDAPRARRPAPSATSSPPRSPAPTASRWARTTTASPARRWCSWPTARPASSCGGRHRRPRSPPTASWLHRRSPA